MLSGSALDGVAMPRLTSWSFDKAYERPQTTESVDSSPNLSNLNDSEVIAVTPPRERPIPPKICTDDASLQDKYLSSEEDLSPIGSDFSSDFELDEEDVRFETATVVRAPVKIPEPAAVARVVSYISAGRPKVVDVTPSPTRQSQDPFRSHSLTPSTASARSEYSTPPSSNASSASVSPPPPATSAQPNYRSLLSEFTGWEQPNQPRPLPAARPVQSNRESISSLASTLYSSAPNDSRYPAAAHPQSQVTKASAALAHATRSHSISVPLSPDNSSFLNTDPFGPESRSSASPTISAGRRLRGLSRTLTLAKAISKRRDAPVTRDHQTGLNLPLTPGTPATPMSPLSPGSPARRKQSSDDFVPPVPQLSRPKPKMVARGANERAAPLQLPPFPEDDMDFFRSESRPRLRKRKSLISLYS